MYLLVNFKQKEKWRDKNITTSLNQQCELVVLPLHRCEKPIHSQLNLKKSNSMSVRSNYSEWETCHGARHCKKKEEIILQYFCKGAEHLLDVHTSLVNAPGLLIVGDLQDLHYFFFFLTALLFSAEDSVTTHIHFSLQQKVRGVPQQEICFIKPNNWLKRFPWSPQLHTNGLNSSHML